MFHPMMSQGEMPMVDLMRILQVQNRPNEKEAENGSPNSGNKDFKVEFNN